MSINLYGSTQEIIISLFVILISIGFSVFLVFRIMRERSRIFEEKLSDGVISLEKFDAFVSRRIEKAAGERFVIAIVEITNYNFLLEIYGEKQCNNIMHIIRERLFGLTTSGGKFSQSNNSAFTLYIRNMAGKKTLDTLGSFIVEECAKRIQLADAVKAEPQVSVAIASYPASGKTYESIMSGVRLSLAVAKRKGSNNFEVHTLKLENEESDEYKHYMEIKSAVEKKQFIIYYQPIIDLKTEEVHSIEALLRWRHPALGIVEPKEFFDIIESSGDIYWLGLWTFEQMLCQLAQWRISYPDKAICCNVNLSLKQLMHPTLFDDLRFIMKKSKLANSEVCFEITETAIMLDDKIVNSNINKLREVGFLVAVDNYGDAEASLKMLFDLKTDAIKISRNYILKSCENSMVKDILLMLIKNSNAKKVKLIAQGIENKQDLEYVKALGLDYAQGYYFNKPLPASECISNIVMTPWKTINE